MKKTISAFGFRFEKGLGKRIRRFCRDRTISLNTLARRSIVCLSRLHDEGLIRLDEPSGFMKRFDVKDKETTVLVLHAGQREMVRNFAFSYRLSMAEVIRMALEVYLDCANKEESKLDGIIHIYREPRSLFKAVLISLYPALPSGKVPYPLLL